MFSLATHRLAPALSEQHGHDALIFLSNARQQNTNCPLIPAYSVLTLFILHPPAWTSRELPAQLFTCSLTAHPLSTPPVL